MIYLGIDPGATGGLSVIMPEGLETEAVGGKTLLQTWTWIDQWGDGLRTGVYAVIEKVGGYVGGAGDLGSTMFQFGASFGALRAFLVAASIPFAEVVPQRWQAEFGLKRAKNESKGKWKGRLAAEARRLYPDAHITVAVADAVLIAEYCRRMRTVGLRRKSK